MSVSVASAQYICKLDNILHITMYNILKCFVLEVPKYLTKIYVINMNSPFGFLSHTIFLKPSGCEVERGEHDEHDFAMSHMGLYVCVCRRRLLQSN